MTEFLPHMAAEKRLSDLTAQNARLRLEHALLKQERDQLLKDKEELEKVVKGLMKTSTRAAHAAYHNGQAALDMAVEKRQQEEILAKLWSWAQQAVGGLMMHSCDPTHRENADPTFHCCDYRQLVNDAKELIDNE